MISPHQLQATDKFDDAIRLINNNFINLVSDISDIKQYTDNLLQYADNPGAHATSFFNITLLPQQQTNYSLYFGQTDFPKATLGKSFASGTSILMFIDVLDAAHRWPDGSALTTNQLNLNITDNYEIKVDPSDPVGSIFSDTIYLVNYDTVSHQYWFYPGAVIFRGANT